MDEPLFLGVEDILYIHRREIERSGGTPGLRIPDAVEAAAAAPRVTHEEKYARARLAPESLQPKTTSGNLITLDTNTVARYYQPMVKSFRCRETEKLFQRRYSRKFSAIRRAALKKLLIVDAAGALSDLRVPPANRLEKLSGGRRGQHSVRVNDQWRICFRWKAGDAYDVEIVDYH